VIPSVDPDLVANSSTLDELLRRSPIVHRLDLAAAVASTVGLFGLLLALMGIYGTVSYIVVLRTREIGIRMAIGAQKARISLGLILGESTRPVLAGLLAGNNILADFCGGSLLPALRGMLYGLSIVDGISFAASPCCFWPSHCFPLPTVAASDARRSCGWRSDTNKRAPPMSFPPWLARRIVPPARPFRRQPLPDFLVIGDQGHSGRPSQCCREDRTAGLHPQRCQPPVRWRSRPSARRPPGLPEPAGRSLRTRWDTRRPRHAHTTRADLSRGIQPGKSDRLAQAQMLPQFVQRAGEKAVHTAHHQDENSGGSGEKWQNARSRPSRFLCGCSVATLSRTARASAAERSAANAASTPSGNYPQLGLRATGSKFASPRRSLRSPPAPGMRFAPTKTRRSSRTADRTSRNIFGMALVFADRGTPSLRTRQTSGGGEAGIQHPSSLRRTTWNGRMVCSQRIRAGRDTARRPAAQS